MSSTKSILIVGGGVIGLCAAYYALQKGFSVTVVERGAPDHDACSLGNAGMVTPSHFIPLASPGIVALGLKLLPNPEGPLGFRFPPDLALIDWAWKFYSSSTTAHITRSAPLLRDLLFASRSEFEKLAETLPLDFGLTKLGLLTLCKSKKTLEHEAELAKMAHKLGIEAEVLSAEETAKRDPAITMDVAGSVYFAQDCCLTPQKFVTAMTEEILRAGGKIVWSSDVIGWKRNGRSRRSRK